MYHQIIKVMNTNLDETIEKYREAKRAGIVEYSIGGGHQRCHQIVNCFILLNMAGVKILDKLSGKEVDRMVAHFTTKGINIPGFPVNRLTDIE
jgi:hypothetical protein